MPHSSRNASAISCQLTSESAALSRSVKLQSAAGDLLKRGLQWVEARNPATRGTAKPADPALLSDLAEFYRGLGRHAESDAWRQLAAELVKD